jgi:hypothetical protein
VARHDGDEGRHCALSISDRRRERSGLGRRREKRPRRKELTRDAKKINGPRHEKLGDGLQKAQSRLNRKVFEFQTRFTLNSKKVLKIQKFQGIIGHALVSREDWPGGLQPD